MPKKQKFNPKITRVKLNAEQAVLACFCFSQGMLNPSDPGYCYGGFLQYLQCIGGPGTKYQGVRLSQGWANAQASS